MIVKVVRATESEDSPITTLVVHADKPIEYKCLEDILTSVSTILTKYIPGEPEDDRSNPDPDSA